MEILQAAATLASLEADAVIVGVYEEGCSASADAVDRANGGVIARLLEVGEFKPDVGKVLPLYYPQGVKSPIVLLTGLGTRKASSSSVFRAMATATRWLTERARSNLAITGDAAWAADVAEAAVVGAAVGCVGPGLYQAKPNRVAPGAIQWLDVPSAAIDSGRIIADAVNLTRQLVNEPPSVIYPETFAQAAQKVAAQCKLAIETWDLERLQSENCGALLAVAQGSARPPRLVILRHQGAAPDAPWLGLIGKGVTFDSGGLSIKPSEGMLTMKCDMAGAAAVLGAMQGIALLQLPLNVMGLVGLVENMPSATSYKLGDVLTTRCGKTIEVHNTDAEGRLVLADVLAVAVDRGADKLIDLATLTGACVVALGTDVAGLMSNDQAWCDKIKAAADRVGERVWQLPMFPEYAEQIKSSVADMKNVGEGRWGGAITAAKLLEEFVAGHPWTHIDIAGPAFLEKPKPWLDAGASGALVRTLVEVARTWARGDM
jgi:leucyl aminopeptidase